MAINKSLVFDTIKVNMLVSFAKDLSIPQPENFAEFLIEDKRYNLTYEWSKEFAECKLAWSLIKCGIKYGKGGFYWQAHDANYAENLEGMLSLVFKPYLDYWNKP